MWSLGVLLALAVVLVCVLAWRNPGEEYSREKLERLSEDRPGPVARARPRRIAPSPPPQAAKQNFARRDGRPRARA
jgi:hypothetical protein